MAFLIKFLNPPFDIPIPTHACPVAYIGGINCEDQQTSVPKCVYANANYLHISVIGKRQSSQ